MSLDDLHEEIKRWRINTTTAHMVGAGLRIESPPQECVCPCCKTHKDDVATRRLNTAYAADESNWLESCGTCFEEAVEHYQDLWDTYYGGCM